MCILAHEMFNLPNLMTAGNLLCGISSIFMVFSGQLEIACYLIYLAAILDFLDGFIARKLNQMSELGKQLDSLADMVTSGVVPGYVMYQMLLKFKKPNELPICERAYEWLEFDEPIPRTATPL